MPEELTEEQKEQRRKRKREWQEANREKVREENRAYAAKPDAKERARQRAQERYQDPEVRARILARNREWRQANKEKCAEYSRRWNEKNPERRREAWIRHKYPKLTDAQYRAIVEHNGVCDSCGEEPAKHIDHDHASGEYRGYLCKGCNQAAGLLRDNPSRALALATYLVERTPAPE
ncbi:endonuclease domain-containing protein [Streptomyces sp. NPDC004721]